MQTNASFCFQLSNGKDKSRPDLSVEDRERGKKRYLGARGAAGDRQNGQDEEVHGDATAEGLAEALGPAAPTAAGLLSGTYMIFF